MKILCIGSFNRDYVYRVQHIPQAGETITAQDRKVFWGGKGLNQALAAARSCDAVYLAGSVNHSETDLSNFLKENNIHKDFVRYIDAPTGHTVICVDEQGQNNIIVYGGSNRMLTQETVRDTLRCFSPGDIVLVQNETNLLEEILMQAHEQGLRVAMNPSPFEAALLDLPLSLVDIFLVNEIEAYQITGKRQPQEIVPAFLERFPRAALVLTLGKDGAVYADNTTVLRHGTYRVNVVDTTAAGDTFTGYFLSGLARGLTPGQCLEQASKASSIAVSREGATSSIPALAEVLAFDAPYQK